MTAVRRNRENMQNRTDDTKRRRAVPGRDRAKRSTFAVSGIAVFTAALFIIFGLLIAGSFQSFAQDESGIRETYYKSITIEKGDTLWNIAEEYITDDFDSIEEYISALKNMNNLKNDRIFFGDKLIVAYNPKL